MKPSRRATITLLAGMGPAALGIRSGLGTAGTARAQEKAAKPNILFILADNLGYGELGVYGGGATRGAPTPRIDKLASEGLRLTNMNMEAQCTPSRSAILTGRYAIRSGTHSVPFGGVADGLTQWEVTMAESLSAAGYATALYGKWHRGSHDGRLPNDQGFDEWYGIPRTTDEALWPSAVGYSPSIMPPEQIMEGRKGGNSRALRVYDLEQRRLIDAEITRRTIAFMERQAQARRPFFAYATITRRTCRRCLIRRSRGRPATATGPTCWPKWTTMSGRCSTRWTGWAFATAPS
jgi:arylsulfatase